MKKKNNDECYLNLLYKKWDGINTNEVVEWLNKNFKKIKFNNHSFKAFYNENSKRINIMCSYHDNYLNEEEYKDYNWLDKNDIIIISKNNKLLYNIDNMIDLDYCIFICKQKEFDTYFKTKEK